MKHLSEFFETTRPALCRHRCSLRSVIVAVFLLLVAVPRVSAATESAGVPVSGNLEDATCNAETVKDVNTQVLNRDLKAMTSQTYFRLFQVDMENKCTYFDNGDQKENLDSSQAQSSQTKEDEKKNCDWEPFGFASNEPPPCEVSQGTEWDNLLSTDVRKTLARPDRTLSSAEVESIERAEEITECDEDLPSYWLDMCDKISTQSSEFINLQLNPEAYTGYNGTKIWEEMYSENCFSTQEEGKDMCYENRVLYRLMSGTHAAVNIHIAMNYYPPMKGKRDKYEANPEHFFRQYGKEPERLKNLHFAFVVMLRALRKAAPVLWNYDYTIGDATEDERTSKLVQRVLDTYVLESCASVFEAFDESLLFSTAEHPSTMQNLKKDFKGIFHKISALFDCITCQKCKLHGKVYLLGIGTALKILLLPESLLSTGLHRSEVVAFFNTLGRFSDAIEGIDSLTQQYWDKLKEKAGEAAKNVVKPPVVEVKPTVSTVTKLSETDPAEVFDLAIGAIADSAQKGLLQRGDEDTLIDLMFAEDYKYLSLANHYARIDPARFVQHAVRNIGGVVSAPAPPVTDAVVVGGGLAGLSAALTLLDRGAKVIIIDKEGLFGGNSAWASSGINAVDDATATEDSVEKYKQDTLKSGALEESEFISVLASKSGEALAWIRQRLELPLENVGQLGGHSHPRTYRPSTGLAGQELIAAIQKQLKKYNDSPLLTILKKTKVTDLLQDESGKITGVAVQDVKTGETKEIKSENVILATGGFANNNGTPLVKKYRPELAEFATTNGRWAIGEGHLMAEKAGAKLIDMEQIQVHPTGWIDPKNPNAEMKTLCAEILRGVGGILVDKKGQRFADELGTRDYLSGEILKRDPENKQVILILNSAAAAEAPKHIPLYKEKKLLFEFATSRKLAEWMGIPAKDLHSTFDNYNKAATSGKDEFGKTTFNNMPYAEGPFFAGTVTPVLHYTMGGIKINTKGEVIGKDDKEIKGLYAAGEIIGGLHGKNRLGGNSLTECLVFGRIIGENLEIQSKSQPPQQEANPAPTQTTTTKTGPRVISMSELEQHNTADDCWVAIHGKVYDLTEFAEDHPAGPEAVTELAGKIGDAAFDKVHGPAILDDFEPIGVLGS